MDYCLAAGTATTRLTMMFVVVQLPALLEASSLILETIEADGKLLTESFCIKASLGVSCFESLIDISLELTCCGGG